MARLFISWSGDVSEMIASRVCTIVEKLPLGVDCWISNRTKDNPQGPGDHPRIVKAAQKSDMCLSIVTPENYKAPWLFFEAGIFYGLKKPVIGVLCCGATHTILKQSGSPIGEGYHAYLNKDTSFLSLIETINGHYNKVAKDRYIASATTEWEQLSGEFSNTCEGFHDLQMKAEFDH